MRERVPSLINIKYRSYLKQKKTLKEGKTKDSQKDRC